MSRLLGTLYLGLFLGMLILFVVNFNVAWIFFAFFIVAILFGGLLLERPALLAAGFLLAALSVLGVGLVALQPAWPIHTWPTVSGLITKAEHCTKSVNHGLVYAGPCIEYRYQVEGQTFTANTKDSEEFALYWWFGIPPQYQADRNMAVYYNPDNPGQSRLNPDLPRRDVITTAIGASLAVLSAFTVIWLLLHPKGKPRPTPQVG